jgi:flagellar motor protein MotB
MGKLTNALQGNLNDDRGPGRVRSGRQLDLFLSLSDRAETKPRIVSSQPRPGAAEPPAQSGPEMILPPSAEPPDVSADVRAVLSDSEPASPVEGTAADGEGRPPLRTGIYRRPPRRVAPAPAPAASASPPRSAAPKERWSALQWLQDWFAGVELDRRMVSLVLVLVVVVALVAFWSACPRQRDPEPGTLVDLREIHRSTDDAAPTPVPAVIPVPSAPGPSASSASPAPSTPRVAADWKIAGAETTVADGTYSVRFTDPVFVSADNISVEGMRALKSLAAKLVALKAGARVVVTGHTDDVPLSRPTPQFRNNADIAEARGKAAMEHLAHFARANKALVFEMRAGPLAEAPYPNDSPRNRRLNRTATVQVMPAGN